MAWLVLRGSAEVNSREGNFMLRTREWMLLDQGSATGLVPGRGALVLCAAIATDDSIGPLFPGRGCIPRGLGGRALRLWRAQGAFARGGGNWVATDDAHGWRLLDLLSLVQGELHDGIRRCPGHTDRRRRQVLLRMQRARMYLEGQAGSGLRIADLARRSNFSPWYFSKVFHTLYGIGPLQFAARARLEQAAWLLATTRLPVTEVSISCGFDNPCSFARAFRARFGMTASEHRVRNRSEG